MHIYRKTIVLCLAALLCLPMLGGCSGSTGEYYTESSHAEKQTVLPTGTDDSGINGYYTLKGAILNMIGMGLENDVFRVGSYSGDLEGDLKAVVQEITTSEPIGIYGVSSITIEQTRILTYRELSVSVQYKRSTAELRSIVEVRGDYDLQARILSMLTSMSEGKVYEVSDGVELADKIQRWLYSTWMNCGSDAPGVDSIAVDFYPEGQDNAILELRPQYLTESTAHEVIVTLIEAHANAVCDKLAGEEELESQLQQLSLWLYENAVYDRSAQRVVNETGGNQRKSSIYTAYGALVEGEAAQSGFVLAASAVLTRLGIEHEVLTGNVGEDIYSWISVNDGDHTIVFDVTALQNGREQIIYAPEGAAEVFVEWE